MVKRFFPPIIKRIFFIICLVGFFATGIYMFFTPDRAEASWYSSSWSFRKKLVIDESKVSGSSDLINFPVLVSRIDTDLKSNAQSDGDDIVFTSSDGSTKLDHEIESYNSSTGELIAWVRVPTLDYNDDTTVYMYYGNSSVSNQQNSTGSWNSNYAGVWHLKEDPTGSSPEMKDSTSTSNDGNAISGLTSGDLITGKIGNAIDFDASGTDYIDLENGNAYDALSQGTISAWIYVKGPLNKMHGIFSSGPSPNWFEFGIYQGNFHIWSSDGLRGSATTTPILANRWYYVSYVVNGTGNTFYVNGVAQSVSYESGSASSTTFWDDESGATSYNIGQVVSSGGEELDGSIDELHVTNTAFSADWISTEYANQSDPTSFFKSVSDVQMPNDPELRFSFNEGNGTTVYNSGTNGIIGTISGASWRSSDLCLSGSCLYFDGTNDVVTTATTTSGVKSVAFWVRPSTTSEQYIDLNGSAYIQSSSGTVSATGFTSPTIYINGQPGTTISANRWNHIVVTTNTGINSTAFKIGQISSNYGQGFFDEISLFPSVLSAGEVKALYSSLNGSTASTQFGAKDATALSDGLVGYWPMNETSANTCTGGVNDTCDVSGNLNDGYWNGGAAPFSAKYGNGTSFDGSGDSLVFPDSNSLDITQEITLAMWLRRGSDGTPMSHYLYKGWDASINYSLSPDYENIEFSYYDGADYHKYLTTSDPIANLNTWYFVVFTNEFGNPNSAHFYVNGEVQDGIWDSGDGLAAAIANTASLSVSGRNDGAWGNYDMDLDELRIYNRYLSSAEAKQLYNWAPDPIAYYKLDEKTGTTSVYDSSGNGFTGTMNSLSSDDWVTGKYGAALDFDAVNDSVSIADNDAFSVNTTNQLSVMGWVYVDSLTSLIEPISKGAGSNYEWFIRVDNSNNSVRAYLTTSSGADYLTALGTSNTFTVGAWNHIAMTANLSIPELRLYVNGVNIATGTTPSGSYTNGTAQVRIGERADGSRDLDGIVDDVKIYNYARTARQIIEDMNAGHPITGSGAGTAGYWKFNEGYGTTSNDSSSLDNDLTLSNVSWAMDGKLGKSWNGTGANWVSRADDNDFDFSAAEDLAISAWFKSDSATNPASTEYLLSKSNGTTQGYALYFQTDGDLVFGIDDDATWSPDDSAGDVGRDIYDGNWHHVVAMKNGTSKIQIFIDGRLISEDTSISATGTLANSTSLVIGDRTGVDDGNEFFGDVDEIKVYRSLLTVDQIMEEFRGGSAISMGSSSTTSTGTTASNSSSREYCVPGDTTTCSPPIAEWRFDEGTGSVVNDITGGGSNGTWTGSGSPRFLPGKVGKAGNFTGESAADHVDITNMTTSLRNIASGSGQITMSAWIYPRTFGGGGFGFIISPGWGVGPSFILDDGTYYNDSLRVNLGPAHSFNSDANSVVLNQWQYVTMVYNNGTSSGMFYVNGRPVGFNFVHGSGGLSNSTDTWDIGNSPNEATRHFDGLIDSVRVYDYVRTPAQIAWDYNQGDPVGYWKFNEASGTTAYDASGNSSNGTLTNSPTRLTSGRYNSAISFDGINDYVLIGDRNLLSFGDGSDDRPFSITAWVYMGDTSDFVIASKGDNATSNLEWSFDTAPSSPGISGELELALFDTSGANQIFAYTTSNLSNYQNQWTHLAATYDGSNNGGGIALYVNGKDQVLSTSSQGTYNGMEDTSSNMNIGAFVPTDATYKALSEGSIDDVRMYNYALTAEQVKLVMNEGSAVKFK
ncbi:DUF2341 domain-containing protein [candidate division WWE3 bacterium]|nr:DUF2341 domain-containing protein [candidate division WWE3 bacterium]